MKIKFWLEKTYASWKALQIYCLAVLGTVVFLVTWYDVILLKQCVCCGEIKIVFIYLWGLNKRLSLSNVLKWYFVQTNAISLYIKFGNFLELIEPTYKKKCGNEGIIGWSKEIRLGLCSFLVIKRNISRVFLYIATLDLCSIRCSLWEGELEKYLMKSVIAKPVSCVL